MQAAVQDFDVSSLVPLLMDNVNQRNAPLHQTNDSRYRFTIFMETSPTKQWQKTQEYHMHTENKGKEQT